MTVIKFGGLPSKCISQILTGYNFMDWPCADQQHVVFLQQSGNIECTINEVGCFSSYLLHGGLELPCALHFLVMQKLGRSYKLSARNINIDRI